MHSIDWVFNKLNTNYESLIRNYYDKNTSRFLRYGQGGKDYTIHRVVSHPEAVNPSRFQEECILRLLKQYAVESVIDLGCGVGSSLAWLSGQHSAHYTGLTLSPIQAEIARKMLGDSINIITGSYLDEDSYRRMTAPAGRQMFYGIESWLHCANPHKLINLIQKRCRSGDILLFWDDFPATAIHHNHHIEDFRKGWHAINLLSQEQSDAIVGSFGFRSIIDQDYSPFLEIDRIRDYVIAASLPLLRIFRLKSPWWQNLLGGNALRRLLKDRVLSYRLKVWMRRER